MMLSKLQQIKFLKGKSLKIKRVINNYLKLKATQIMKICGKKKIWN